MDRIKSALFLDFDNIFCGLHSRDPQSAYDFAENSGKWLAALGAYGLAEGVSRALLIQRVYLNPYGGNRIKDEERGAPNFHRFRRKLTQSGFEVVECFSLTSQQKNAADIRIVIDILQSLSRPTRYDEYIIASSDSDFTPLLRCLRASDRRTMIIFSGQKTVQAYRNASEALIDAADLVNLPIASSQNESPATNAQNKAQKPAKESPAKNESAPAAEPPVKPPLAETQSEPRESSGKTVAENKSTPSTDAQNQVLKTARELIANNENATALSDISRELRNRFGQEIEQSPSKWFGHKTLAKFLLQNFDNLKQDDNLIWIADKSQNPKISAEDLPETAPKSSAENLPAIVAQICQITDLPRLIADHWAETLKMLARYARSQSHGHEFKMSECTLWVRDQLKEKEIPVGRTAIDRIIQWAKHGGVSLDADPPPTGDKIREAVIQNAVIRAGEANLNLTLEKQEKLRNWLQGGNSDFVRNRKNAQWI